jgi:hypothetical protein
MNVMLRSAGHELRFTEKADKDYAALPVIIRKALGKQLRFLLANRGPPSLHAKKYSEALDVWQCRGNAGLALQLQNRGR